MVASVVLALALQAQTLVGSPQQQQLFADLNRVRIERGLPALQLDARLSGVAATHARDMAQNNFFAHLSRDGRTPFDRLRDGGIQFRYAGENIAMSPSASTASDALYNSAPHRENMLDPNYRRVGIAVSKRADGELFFVEDFSD